MSKDTNFIGQPIFLQIIKYLNKNKTLSPIEMYRYDNWVILEALNNCLAHQDYTNEDKLIVTETANYELIFKNTGSFYYGKN